MNTETGEKHEHRNRQSSASIVTIETDVQAEPQEAKQGQGAKQWQDAARNFVNTNFRAHERARTERTDTLWYQDQAVIVHEPSVIASTLWIGRDAVDQAWTF